MKLSLEKSDLCVFEFFFSILVRTAVLTLMLKKNSKTHKSDFFFSILVRTAVLTLGFCVAVNQLDNRHWRSIGCTETGTDDPRIATVTVAVAFSQSFKKFLFLHFVHQA